MNQRFLINSIEMTIPLKRHTSAFLLMSFLFISQLAGCSGDKETVIVSKSTIPVIACEILKTDEVESIIGSPVAEPRKTHKVFESSEHWMSMCNYYAEEKQVGMGVTITPHGRKGTANDAYTLHIAELKETLGNDYSLEAIEGVGDIAGWNASTKQLTIFQGPFMVIVGIVSPKLEGANALELSQQLAEKFLLKLSY